MVSRAAVSLCPICSQTSACVTGKIGSRLPAAAGVLNSETLSVYLRRTEISQRSEKC